MLQTAGEYKKQQATEGGTQCTEQSDWLIYTLHTNTIKTQLWSVIGSVSDTTVKLVYNGHPWETVKWLL